MIKEDRIYCVGCHSVVKKEKAGKIFRTGFYKCDMHLGLCVVCSDSEPDDHAAVLPETEEPAYIAVEPL